MRIVFDFHGKDPTAGGSGSLYGNSIVKPPEWPGFSVDLVICDAEQPRNGDPFWEGDTIHLEGNGETIREALKQALRIVDTVEKIAREQFVRRVARTHQCVTCKCWLELTRENKFPPHGSPLCKSEGFVIITEA